MVTETFEQWKARTGKEPTRCPPVETPEHRHVVPLPNKKGSGSDPATFAELAKKKRSLTKTERGIRNHQHDPKTRYHDTAGNPLPEDHPKAG